MTKYDVKRRTPTVAELRMATTPNLNEEVHPSAPPAWMAPEPPRYDAVASPNGGYSMRRRDQLTASVRAAG